MTAKFYMERSFIQVLLLLEHLQLSEAHRCIFEMLASAKSSNNGLLESAMGLDEPYLVLREKLQMFVYAISNLHGLSDPELSEIRDLRSIIKRSVYAICDTGIFANVPKNEAEVHDRIEAILKCHFSDLKRKPSLTKPIKNFEPDTGIPSLKTLIEYKYVTTKKEAKIVVDQILADTQGYKSGAWRKILFVVYETHRVMPEEDWKDLLKECELSASHDVVVLSGDAKGG